MTNANKILDSLSADKIHQRIIALDKERKALVVLHRAAIRLDRQPKPKQEAAPCK